MDESRARQDAKPIASNKYLITIGGISVEKFMSRHCDKPRSQQPAVRLSRSYLVHSASRTAAFSLFDKSRPHRTSWNEDCGQMTKGQSTDQKTRHNLSQIPAQSRIESVVRQKATGGRLSDHIART